MIDYNESGTIGGMRIGRGNRNTRRKKTCYSATFSIINPT
jgi:hypothetical protein